MERIKATTSYQGLQGEYLTDTTKLEPNQRRVLACVKQTTVAGQLRRGFQRTLPLVSQLGETRAGGSQEKLSAHCTGTVPPANPGGEGGRQVLHLWAKERNKNSGAKRTSADYGEWSRAEVQTHHAPARATPSGNGEAQREFLSPGGRRIRQCPRKAPADKMSQGSFASLLIPPDPTSGLKNRTASATTPRQHVVLQFKCKGDHSNTAHLRKRS